MAARHRILLAICIAWIVLFSWLPPIAQPQWYHDFSDHGSLLGLPHFFNVSSNLAFVLVAVWGLWQLSGGRSLLQYTREYRLWCSFFIAILLVGIGSSYYHLSPGNDGLVWDRLPIALAFALLLVISLEERVDSRLSTPALLLLLPFAVYSVVYWWWTEHTGSGDLRPYLFLQLLTLSLLPTLYLLYPGRYKRRRDMLLTIALYFLAISCEWLDHFIHEITQVISGHTLKHLLIALAVARLVRMLRTGHLHHP